MPGNGSSDAAIGGGQERAEWYARGVEVLSAYADYEVSAEHDRVIPVFVATPFEAQLPKAAAGAASARPAATCGLFGLLSVDPEGR